MKKLVFIFCVAMMISTTVNAMDYCLGVTEHGVKGSASWKSIHCSDEEIKSFFYESDDKAQEILGDYSIFGSFASNTWIAVKNSDLEEGHIFNEEGSYLIGASVFQWGKLSNTSFRFKATFASNTFCAIKDNETRHYNELESQFGLTLLAEPLVSSQPNILNMGHGKKLALFEINDINQLIKGTLNNRNYYSCSLK